MTRASDIAETAFYIGRYCKNMNAQCAVEYATRLHKLSEAYRRNADVVMNGGPVPPGVHPKRESEIKNAQVRAAEKRRERLRLKAAEIARYLKPFKLEETGDRFRFTLRINYRGSQHAKALVIL